jgi:exodeoxyribonuclease VII small subunit
MTMDESLDDLTFEQALAELQAAVEELRGDDLSLERTLALFERGVSLAGRCDVLLTKAELRVSTSLPSAQPANPLPAEPDDRW